MNHIPRPALATLLLLWIVPSLPATDSWPQFRGPDGQGQAPHSSPPVQFGKDDGIRWRTPVEGKGWSSPVVAQGRVWLTTAIAQPATPEEIERKLGNDPMAKIKEVAGSIEIKVLCISAQDGRILHSISLAKFEDPDPINPLNTYASPTPVIDEGRVYCDFGNYGTWCLDTASGEIIWQKRTIVDYSVGAGSSPIIIGNKLILVCDGIDQQFVMALDKQTGQQLWRTPRPPMRSSNVEYQKAYSTPLVVEVNGQTQIVVPAAQWLCSYDPRDGAEIWRFDHGDGFSVSPRPLFVDNMIVFSTGYMRAELVAVRPDGSGDVTRTHQAWRASRGVPSKPSPIAVGDRIYMVSDNGVLTQLHVADGSIAWQERLSGNFSASPINAGNRLYFCSHEGVVTVVAPGDSYQQLAENQLEPRLLASPAVVGNDLLFRSEQALLRIGRDE